MTVEECYREMEADYEGAKGRLLKDDRIEKYLQFFLQDETYANLSAAVAQRNYEQAFEEAHNLKGAALNLGITGVHQEAEILCELLRPGKPVDGIDEKLKPVTREYEKAANAIRKL